MRSVILDTGPLVAFLAAGDAHHSWAQGAFAAIRPPARTCEPVITEAWHLLRRHPGGQAALLALMERGLVRIDYVLQEDAAAVAALVAKYSDVPMSLADACLVRMAERSPEDPIVTLDSDFLVYRRSGRGAIALVTPGV